MFWSRLKYFYRNNLYWVRRFTGIFSLSLAELATKSVFIIVILVLSYNVLIAYNKGVDNIRRIEEERQKLIELQLENNELLKQQAYYGSLEYKKIYARESANLAEQSESLYLIKRPDNANIEKLPAIESKINMENKFFWWCKLLLGL